MENVKNKKVSRLTAIAISAIAALVLSGVASVIAGNSFEHAKEIVNVIASLLVGVMTAFVLMSVALIVIGIIYDTKIATTIGVTLVFFAFVALTITCSFFTPKWWITLILALIALPVLILSLFLIYRKNLVIVYDNEKPDYQNVKQREENKQEEKEQEELPEIKSFK